MGRIGGERRVEREGIWKVCMETQPMKFSYCVVDKGHFKKVKDQSE